MFSGEIHHIRGLTPAKKWVDHDVSGFDKIRSFNIDDSDLDLSGENIDLKSYEGIEVGDPNYERLPQNDITTYLGSLSNEYSSQITTLAEIVGDIDPACMLSVCIPVAAHEEQGWIYRALKCFVKQSVSQNLFELVLLLNFPATDQHGRKVQPDQTISEIQRFKEDYPEVSVVGTTIDIDLNNMSMGLVRGLVTDLTLYRHFLRMEHEQHDHILLRFDADAVGIDRDYIANYLDLFEANPLVDSYVGQVDGEPERFVENPLLYVGQRLTTVFDMGLRVYHGLPPLGGPNHAVRASVYAYVTGYDHMVLLGEDCALAKSIVDARKGATNYIPVGYAGSRSRVFSSSRRAERALHFGYASAMQWHNPDTKFSMVDPGVRAKSGDRRVSTDLRSPQFVQEVESVVNKTLAHYHRFYKQHGFEVDKPVVTTALDFGLGLKYEKNGECSIRITDASRLIEKIQAYQEKGIEIWKRRIGEVWS